MALSLGWGAQEPLKDSYLASNIDISAIYGMIGLCFGYLNVGLSYDVPKGLRPIIG